MNIQEKHIILGKEFTYQELQDKFKIPNNASISGCNLIANDSEEAIKLLDFSHFISCFPLDGFSGASAIKLRQIPGLLEDNLQLFNHEIINISSLRKVGFGPTEATNFIKELTSYKTKGIKVRSIIRSFGINGCGSSTAHEYAKYLSGVHYDFGSKTHAIIQELKDRNIEILTRIETIRSFGFPVQYETETIKIISEDAKKYVLTGSPKQFGYKTKEEFKSLISNWIEVGKIKDADYLITDDIMSKSSKTKEATKLQKQIITYQDAIINYNGK